MPTGTGSDPASIQAKAWVLTVAVAQHQESAGYNPRRKKRTDQLSVSQIRSAAAALPTWAYEQPLHTRPASGIRETAYTSLVWTPDSPGYTGQFNERLSMRQKASVHPHGQFLCTSSLMCHMLAHN